MDERELTGTQSLVCGQICGGGKKERREKKKKEQKTKSFMRIDNDQRWPRDEGMDGPEYEDMTEESINRG